MLEKVRVDKLLWSLRLFKTRSLAAKACQANKVKINGQSVKPARLVEIGERLYVTTPNRNWDIEIIQLLDKRRPYTEVKEYYIDHTPQEETQREKLHHSFYTGKRRSKSGKPTRQQREEMDDFFGF